MSVLREEREQLSSKSVSKQKSGGAKFSRLKWLVACLLLVAGFYANYTFTEVPGALRAAGWVLLAVIIALILVRTTLGGNFWRFTKESRDEMRRVVWPTRQETIQTTGIVFLVVIILALLLWAFDSILLSAISWFTGHGG